VLYVPAASSQCDSATSPRSVVVRTVVTRSCTCRRRRPDDARKEADQLFANLTAILSAADAAPDHVVRAGIFMRDLRRDRPVFNEAWVDYFGAHRPARSAVEVGDFGRAEDDCRFMLEVVAHRTEPLRAWGSSSS
jgi:enamine deaminase RidA (YjgF/YER057c/UK114 family)